VIVAGRLYEAILDRIEAQGYDVFAKRAETSLPYKLRVAVGYALGDPKEMVARVRGGRGGKPRRVAIPE
jgi:hypothetical protein